MSLAPAPRFLIAPGLCLILLAGVGATRLSAAGQSPSSPAIAPADWVNNLTPISERDWTYERAAHLLERAGFGGTPQEISRLAAMTPAAAVDYLVDYQKLDASALPPFDKSGIYPHGSKLYPLQEMGAKIIATGKAYGIKARQKGALPLQPAVDEYYTLLVSEFSEMRRASQWWAERMLLTPRPLEEKLTLFWHDHFATSQEKVLNFELMLGQLETLRNHANGNFHNMLVAVAQDPAMLIWLDNRANVKGKPNENFAREVMELFTMGEGRGYTEKDIRELARALTGWTLPKIESLSDPGKFVDSPKLHDDGVKTFLGETGNWNGYDAIKIILKQPATPRFLTKKLYRYFVREDLDASVNERLAKRLRDANYELKPLLKTIFLSKDFYCAASVGTQIKEPVDFLVSTWRKLGLKRVPGIPDFIETSTTLGQQLFFPPNVAGWPGGKSWINPATLLLRGNYVQMMLFPDPENYVAPDKVVNEGYRKIPLKYREYNIVPHVWDAKTGRMEPVSLARYDQILAGINQGSMGAKVSGKPEASKSKSASAADGKMMADKSSEPRSTEAPPAQAGPTQVRSKMSEIASTERFNLAVGLYHGFIEAYDRVKPIPRDAAQVSFTEIVAQSRATNVSDTVDCFCRRFLSVELEPSRRAAIVSFLKEELGTDRLDFKNERMEEALRKSAHLILSAPEYQLD
ncbi:MAG TPA: DUF1800 domain-containing protein [Planctomycetaceae bacterium]|jgi:hypothetical protein|nr:DUF1800 domain-containing protein [Planctomycetaceae bacterium]